MLEIRKKLVSKEGRNYNSTKRRNKMEYRSLGGRMEGWKDSLLERTQDWKEGRRE